MGFGIVPRIQAQVTSIPFIANNASLKGLLEHPAGPFTIHFWAPTAKWLISAANIADVNRPVEKMSLPQQTAVSVTGIIWARYSLVVVPINYNLMAVNAVMACTGLFHLFVFFVQCTPINSLLRFITHAPRISLSNFSGGGS
jgi:hypothetical protein